VKFNLITSLLFRIYNLDVCLPAGLEAQPFDLLIPSKYKIEFSLGKVV
jgi:hypothetical protein